MQSTKPTFDSNGWSRAKLYGRTTMADGSVNPGRRFDVNDSNQFISADGYVNAIYRDTNSMWYVYSEFLINRDARAGNTVDLTFTLDGKQYPVSIKVDNGKVERLVINELDYGIFDYTVTAPFNIIEFMLTFYAKNSFFTLFTGLCAVGAFYFDWYLAGLLYFEWKRDDLILTKTERFGQ